MRVPAGELIPDGPGGGVGCLGIIFLGLFAMALIGDSCDGNLRRANVVSTGSPATTIGTFRVPAQPHFVVNERFVRDFSEHAAIKMVVFDGVTDTTPNDLNHRLLRKIEGPTREALFTITDIDDGRFSAEDSAWFTTRKETTLSQIYAMLKIQNQGQSGSLDTGGRLNIFYVHDSNSTPWIVSAYWMRGHAWLIRYYPIGHQINHYYRFRVISQR